MLVHIVAICISNVLKGYMINQILKLLFMIILSLNLLLTSTSKAVSQNWLQNLSIVQDPTTQEEKLKKEFEINLQLANQGNADAQNLIGINYAEGEGVEKDDREAIKWFFKSVEQGNTFAACNLALHYGSGRGIKKNTVQSLKWCLISHSLDGLKCHPNDFISALKPTKSQQNSASKLAIEWLRNHPNFSNTFGKKPWMSKNYKFKSRTFRF